MIVSVNGCPLLEGYFTKHLHAHNSIDKENEYDEEGDPGDDDSYLGYSLTTGEFNGDGDNLDVAVGMPRGANLTGKVKYRADDLRLYFQQ